MNAPVPLCRIDDLTEAGAFFTSDLGDTPILVTRAPQGSIHAHVNLCRHRGVRLVFEKQGVTKQFTCLLHGWTYDLEGNMGGLPLARMAQTNPMLATLRTNNALTPLPSELRHGFVWVGVRANAPIDVAAFLGPLDAKLEAVAGWRVESRAEVSEVPRNATFLSRTTALVFAIDALDVFTVRGERSGEERGASGIEHLRLGPC